MEGVQPSYLSVRKTLASGETSSHSPERCRSLNLRGSPRVRWGATLPYSLRKNLASGETGR
jgi:hypothetical protein